MAKRQQQPTRGIAARFALPSFCLIFLLFSLNVVLGKLAVLYGWSRGWLAGDVTEFLLLALSAVLLMLAALAREAQREALSPDSNNHANKRED